MSNEETRIGIEGSEDPNEPDTGADEKEERERTFARRALLQSGWAIPVVLALGMPQNAYAVDQSLHGDDSHADDVCTRQRHDDITLHNDIPHSDVHVDTPPPPNHVDLHSDVPHSDATAHTDHTDC